MKGIITTIFVLLHVTFVWGQETTGSLRGMVLDNNGQPVSSATLVLKNLETNEQIASYSQENGSYHFLNITPADYTLEASFIGYETYQQDFISIRLGIETAHKIMLMEEGLELDQIVVTASKSSSNSDHYLTCLLYTSPSPRDATLSRMPSSA